MNSSLINVIDQHPSIQDARPPWGHVIVSATLPFAQICQPVDSVQSKFQGSEKKTYIKFMNIDDRISYNLDHHLSGTLTQMLIHRANINFLHESIMSHISCIQKRNNVGNSYNLRIIETNFQ